MDILTELKNVSKNLGERKDKQDKQDKQKSRHHSPSSYSSSSDSEEEIAEAARSRKRDKKSGFGRTALQGEARVSVAWPQQFIFRGPGQAPPKFEELSMAELTSGML